MTRGSFRMSTVLMIGALVSSLSMSGALAAGSDDEATPTCKKGEIYDKAKKRCVPQKQSSLTDENKADYAYALTKEGRYEEALAVLDTVNDQENAEVLNYRGYATRKLGRTDEGITYYLKSVEKAPRYAKVREYLGEAYVVKGDLVQARAQLDTIKSICGTDCEEYRDLAEVIADPTKL